MLYEFQLQSIIQQIWRAAPHHHLLNMKIQLWLIKRCQNYMHKNVEVMNTEHYNECVCICAFDTTTLHLILCVGKDLFSHTLCVYTIHTYVHTYIIHSEYIFQANFLYLLNECPETYIKYIFIQSLIRIHNFWWWFGQISGWKPNFNPLHARTLYDLIKRNMNLLIFTQNLIIQFKYNANHFVIKAFKCLFSYNYGSHTYIARTHTYTHIELNGK